MSSVNCQKVNVEAGCSDLDQKLTNFLYQKVLLHKKTLIYVCYVMRAQ